MQVLEGPSLSVRTLYHKIADDPRHKLCTVLSEVLIDKRQYPQWGMLQGESDAITEFQDSAGDKWSISAYDWESLAGGENKSFKKKSPSPREDGPSVDSMSGAEASEHCAAGRLCELASARVCELLGRRPPATDEHAFRRTPRVPLLTKKTVDETPDENNPVPAWAKVLRRAHRQQSFDDTDVHFSIGGTRRLSTRSPHPDQYKHVNFLC